MGRKKEMNKLKIKCPICNCENADKYETVRKDGTIDYEIFCHQCNFFEGKFMGYHKFAKPKLRYIFKFRRYVKKVQKND